MIGYKSFKHLARMLLTVFFFYWLLIFSWLISVLWSTKRLECKIRDKPDFVYRFVNLVLIFLRYFLLSFLFIISIELQFFHLYKTYLTILPNDKFPCLNMTFQTALPDLPPAFLSLLFL